MKKNANAIIAAYFGFFVLMMLSGMFRGTLSDAVYYLAYILPFASVIFVLRDEGIGKNLFSLGKRGVKLFLPTVFPTVLLVAFISYLTSLVMLAIFKKSSVTYLGSDPFAAVLNHAAIPALLEEMLFRYLPLRFIAPHSKRYAVVFSATAFALVHHSFFSIPYALAAGVIFITVDILCDSILPSLILHFVNNAVSVVWSMYFTSLLGNLIFVSVLASFAVFSAVLLVSRRTEYFAGIREIIFAKREKLLTSSFVCFSVLPLAIAVYEIIV